MTRGCRGAEIVGRGLGYRHICHCEWIVSEFTRKQSGFGTDDNQSQRSVGEPKYCTSNNMKLKGTWEGGKKSSAACGAMLAESSNLVIRLAVGQRDSA